MDQRFALILQKIIYGLYFKNLIKPFFNRNDIDWLNRHTLVVLSVIDCQSWGSGRLFTAMLRQLSHVTPC